MKALYDQYINSNYTELEKYALFLINVSNKKHIDKQVAISNAYIKAQRFQIQTLESAKATLMHFIKCELLYTNTASDLEKITAVEYNGNLQELENSIEQIDFPDIVLRGLNSFNFIERKFFDKYLELKEQGQTTKELAEIYGLNHQYCKKLVTHLKKRIKDEIND